MAESKNPPHRTPRLGRGLSSLILTSGLTERNEGAYMPAGYTQPNAPAVQVAASLEVRVSQIAANPYQPRRDFDETGLRELAESMKRQGVLQPLLVCRVANGGENLPFALIAGERRLRAAKLAGLDTVPCMVKEATPLQMLEWALVENIQRADLNPVERARGYREYMDRFQLTQTETAERLSQPRATVANYLRILELCDEVQEMLACGQLTFGHGKVLASLVADPAGQLETARRAVAEGLSVRDVESLLATGVKGVAKARRAETPAYLSDLEQRLSAAVGTRVRIVPWRRKHTGRIVIDYYTLDDFDRIAGRLGLEGECAAE